MPKTYGTVTTFTAGSVLTAAQLNTAGTAINNLVVPPSCQVVRTTDLGSYASNTDITWTTTASWDTDGMFSAGSPTRITIQTTGLYVITLAGFVTASATLTQINPYVFLNNTTNLNYTSYPPYSSTNGFWAYSFVYSFTAGEFITKRVTVQGGSGYTIKGATPTQDLQTRMNVTWIGRTS